MSSDKKALQYRVSVHKSGGYRYASTQPTKVNPNTKQKECRHIHWGSLTENNKFYPNMNYFNATPEERAQLVFPADWDLSELEHLPTPERRAAEKYERMLHSIDEQRKGEETGKSKQKVSTSGIKQLIETLESEGVPSDRILQVIKEVDT